MGKIIIFEDGGNNSLDSSVNEYLSKTLSKKKNEPYLILDIEHPNNMESFRSILEKEVQKKTRANININLATSINQNNINQLDNHDLIISDIRLPAEGFQTKIIDFNEKDPNEIKVKEYLQILHHVYPRFFKYVDDEGAKKFLIDKLRDEGNEGYKVGLYATKHKIPTFFYTNDFPHSIPGLLMLYVHDLIKHKKLEQFNAEQDFGELKRAGRLWIGTKSLENYIKVISESYKSNEPVN